MLILSDLLRVPDYHENQQLGSECCVARLTPPIAVAIPVSPANDALARSASHAAFIDKGAPMADKDLVVHALRELVEALDRRVAHVERLGEARIAREAAGLRKEAVHRIQELTGARPDRDTREAEQSGEVMTDDGRPLRKEEGEITHYAGMTRPPR
jgi:hypothetical protein